MKNTKEEILTQQMTRKEFLKLVVLGILSVFGVSNFLSFWMSHSKQSTHSNTSVIQTSGHGFGSSKFGS